MTLHWREKRKHHSQTDQSASPPDTIPRRTQPSSNQAKGTTPINNDNYQSTYSTNNNSYFLPRNKIDFKHRSSRYRQYSSNNQHNVGTHSNYKYNESRSYRNYQYASDLSSKKQRKTTYNYKHNKNESEIVRIKEDPAYVKCPRPEIEAIGQNNLKYLGEFEHFIREKSDGMNVLCYITQNSVYLIDEEFNIRMVTDVFYGSHGLISMNKIILFDGELIVSKRTNKYKEKYIFYRITDCIAFDGETVSTQNVAQRHQYIDKFINNYNLKLIKYASHKNKFKKDKKESEIEFDKFCGYEPQDEQDTAKNRLLKISTQIDNNYQHTRAIKNKIINLCKGVKNVKNVKDGLFDDQKISHEAQNFAIEKDNYNYNYNYKTQNVLNEIELDAVSILFIKQNIFKATKDNLHKLSLQIKYYDDSNNDEGYFFVDPQTGIETKNDGILFIPQDNSYLMDTMDTNTINNSRMIRIWKTKDLLTVDVKIVKEKSEKEKKNKKRNCKQMNNFIDFNKLNLYIYDDIKKKDVWFNNIDMGQNDEINDHNTPFWNEWHLKQRSKLSVFISDLYDNKQKMENMEYFIVECNYDFSKRSWSLFKLKLGSNKPSSLRNAQDIISRMEECIEINDIIMALK